VGDAQITNSKLATDSVSTSNIIDANVTNAKLAADSVGTNNLIDANVTNSKLAANSVGTTNIIAESVTAAKMNMPKNSRSMYVCFQNGVDQVQNGSQSTPYKTL